MAARCVSSAAKFPWPWVMFCEADHGWGVKWGGGEELNEELKVLWASLWTGSSPATLRTGKFQSLHQNFDHRAFPPPEPAWTGLIPLMSQCGAGMGWCGMSFWQRPHNTVMRLCQKAPASTSQCPWASLKIAVLGGKTGFNNLQLFNTSIPAINKT